MINNNLKIITTVYNAEKYINKCIDSILCQTYDNWKWIIIDDVSSDQTRKIILDRLSYNNKVTIILNSENKKGLRNHYECIPLICNNDNDIILSIDGDDWLYSDDVFCYLNKQYQNDVMLTYGQFVTLSNLESNKIISGCSKPLNNVKEVRVFGNNFSHLKTWKYKLWKNIKLEDLKREDGKFIQRAWDIPMMCPMIEMAGIDRVKFIDKILYVYNNTNPISEWRIDMEEQTNEDLYIRSKKPYERLNN